MRLLGGFHDRCRGVMGAECSWGVSVDPAGFVLMLSALKNLGTGEHDAWRLCRRCGVLL